jgi:hypothetical protein
MGHTPHELNEEFPEQADRIHALKTSDSHFAGLTETYHTVNRGIHRIESGVEPADDLVLEEMKKQRLALKDEIAARLA